MSQVFQPRIQNGYVSFIVTGVSSLDLSGFSYFFYYRGDMK